jgi:hypothetical protein
MVRIYFPLGFVIQTDEALKAADKGVSAIKNNYTILNIFTI